MYFQRLPAVVGRLHALRQSNPILTTGPRGQRKFRFSWVSVVASTRSPWLNAGFSTENV